MHRAIAQKTGLSGVGRGGVNEEVERVRQSVRKLAIADCRLPIGRETLRAALLPPMQKRLPYGRSSFQAGILIYWAESDTNQTRTKVLNPKFRFKVQGPISAN